MIVDQKKTDLVILVPDIDTEAAVKGILSRPKSLGIREIKYEIYKHQGHDPSCFNNGPEFLQSQVNRFCYALIILDFEGSGKEKLLSVPEMEKDLLERLDKSGWGKRAETIVINPELENWVWSDSPHVDEALGWSGRNPSLRQWLIQERMIEKVSFKPSRPKEALKLALRFVNKRPSSAIFLKIAQKASLERCTDPSFIKLKNILKRWFSKESTFEYDKANSD